MVFPFDHPTNWKSRFRRIPSTMKGEGTSTVCSFGTLSAKVDLPFEGFSVCLNHCAGLGIPSTE
jgi:hypothetical protein